MHIFKATNLRMFAISIVKQFKMFTEKTFEEKGTKTQGLPVNAAKLFQTSTTTFKSSLNCHVFIGHPVSPVILKAQKGFEMAIF